MLSIDDIGFLAKFAQTHTAAGRLTFDETAAVVRKVVDAAVASGLLVRPERPASESQKAEG